MTFTEASLTFGSLFLAALFAFYLDSIRERRGTRRWVHEYLGFWRTMLESFVDEREALRATIDKLDSVLGDWLDDTPEASEPDWSAIDGFNFSSAISLTPNLLGEGMSVVPSDLLRSMFILDAMIPGLASSSNSTLALYESEVRPLQLRRAWPLAPDQSRAVSLYRSEVSKVGVMMEALYTQLDDLVMRMQSHHI